MVWSSMQSVIPRGFARTGFMTLKLSFLGRLRIGRRIQFFILLYWGPKIFSDGVSWLDETREVIVVSLWLTWPILITFSTSVRPVISHNRGSNALLTGVSKFFSNNWGCFIRAVWTSCLLVVVPTCYNSLPRQWHRRTYAQPFRSDIFFESSQWSSSNLYTYFVPW